MKQPSIIKKKTIIRIVAIVMCLLMVAASAVIALQGAFGI